MINYTSGVMENERYENSRDVQNNCKQLLNLLAI